MRSASLESKDFPKVEAMDDFNEELPEPQAEQPIPTIQSNAQ